MARHDNANDSAYTYLAASRRHRANPENDPMGMEQRVSFAAEPPAWPTLRDLLASRGFPVTLRMIDDELALPDEQPPDGWRELRLGTPNGMITLRRDVAAVDVVTWGNAVGELSQAWNAVTWALAEAGAGRIRTETGVLTADEYRGWADLPPVLR